MKLQAKASYVKIVWTCQHEPHSLEQFFLILIKILINQLSFTGTSPVTSPALDVQNHTADSIEIEKKKKEEVTAKVSPHRRRTLIVNLILMPSLTYIHLLLNITCVEYWCRHSKFFKELAISLRFLRQRFFFLILIDQS